MTTKTKKYQTHDDLWFKDPEIEWPESMTDPSQDVSIARLVADYISRGAPKQDLQYGLDTSRLDFTEAHASLSALEALQEKQRAEDAELKKKADVDKAAAAEGRLMKVVGQLKSSDLKPGSPEIQALAAELTEILPGFKAAVVAPVQGGDSQA